LETQLQADATGMGVTPLNVIKSLKGRVTLVLRTDAERTFTIPGTQPFTVPAVQFLARVDGLGGSLDPALAKLPMLAVSQEGTVKVYAIKEPSPIEGLQPVLAVDGAALYIASDAAFLKASLARTGGLAQAPEFRSALAELGEKGNGVTYVSPRLFTQLRRLKELNPQLGEESRHAFDMVLGSLPAPKQPLVAVRTNLPEGILYRARWHRSLKQDVAMVTVYNPVTVGVMAAMAIPAFQKVRAASREKAFANNLRKTDAAMQQRILASNTADQWGGADSDSRPATSTADELKEKAIIKNLLQLTGAAFWHMQETGSGVATYAQLVGPDKGIQTLTPVDGEDYTQLVIRSSDTHLMVTTKAGKVVRVER
jgi:type II secretory pathway pseudopilin PulG